MYKITVVLYSLILSFLEYLAPEMVLNNGVDQAADVWALGIIAYEMVMLSTPFADPEGTKVFSKIAGVVVSIDHVSLIPVPLCFNAIFLITIRKKVSLYLQNSPRNLEVVVCSNSLKNC